MSAAARENLRSQQSSSRRAQSQAVVPFAQLDKVGQRVQQLKDNRQRAADEAEEIVRRETENERNAVEAAVRAYNEKLRAATRRDDVLALQRQVEDTSYEIEDTIDQISAAYRQAVRAIRRDRSLSLQEKREQVAELERQISRAVLTKREHEMMEAVQKQIDSFFGAPVAAAMGGVCAMGGDRSDEPLRITDGVSKRN